MKHVKFLVIILLFAIFLSACSASSVEIVPEYDASVDKENADLLGYEYIISALAHGDGQGAYALNPVPGYNVRSDRLLQRYKETEEKHNVTISHINGVNLGQFSTYYLAGQKYADLIFTSVGGIFDAGYPQNGYMHAFSDMDIDLHSGIYGTDFSLEAGRLGDDYYTIMAYYWGLPAADIMPVMWFNPRTLGNFQQPSPHELNEQGIWNWDSFDSMCVAIRDTSDPDETKHSYAIGYGSNPYLEMGALFSNNAHFAVINDDGRMVYAMNRPEALEAMDFVVSLAERNLIVDIGDRFNITPFVENRVAFFMEYAHMGLSSEGSDNLAYRVQDSFEWIYFPRGPKGQDMKSKVTYGYNSRFFFAPSNSDIEVHEVLLPTLFQILPGETKEDWQNDFERNNFYSKESFNYFVEMRDTAVYDYSSFVDFGRTIEPLIKKIVRGQASASEAFESIKDQIQSYIDSHYNDYLD